MIRFSCPACHKVFKVVDSGAGRKINCPQCGQRLLVPTPPQPEAVNKTVLAQLTPSTSTPLAPVESDNLVQPGLRKDGDRGERGGERAGCKPVRSWTATVCAFLALILAVAAVPASVVYHHLLGYGLASLAVMIALFAVFQSLFRKGFGLAALVLVVSVSMLLSVVLMTGDMPGFQGRQLASWDENTGKAVSSRSEKSAAQPKREAEPTGGETKADKRTAPETTPASSQREAKPTEEKSPSEKGTELDQDEIRDLKRWLTNLRTDLGDPDDNPIRYRALLQKAEEKAQGYTRAYKARKVCLGFNLTVNHIDENGVYLNTLLAEEDGPRLDPQDHKGENDLLLLKVGTDLSNEAVLDLKRGQYLYVKADVVRISVEAMTDAKPPRFSHIKITVKNLRLPKKNDKSGQQPAHEAKRKEEKPKTEDDGGPQFDANDLQRTVQWGWSIIDSLQQDADNAIRHRAALEKLRKDIGVHENAKVRWIFVVASIKEDRVELAADRRHGNSLISRTGSVTVTNNNKGFTSVSLKVGQGISQAKAAKLKPGDMIVVSAVATTITLEDRSITIVLKDAQAVEARKDARGERQDGTVATKLAVRATKDAGASIRSKR